METGKGSDEATRRRGRRIALLLVELAVVCPTVLYLGWAAANGGDSFPVALFLFWASMVAVVELLPVPAWRSLQISLGLPVLTAAAILYEPWFAALIAMVGSCDPREFRHEMTLFKALFNRSQIALTVLTSAVVIHATVPGYPSPAYGKPAVLLPMVLVGVAASYIVNVALVTLHASVEYGASPVSILARLRIGGLSEFLISYAGLGLIGAILAILYRDSGPLAMATVLAPLLFARQMFFRSKALEEASDQLRDRQRVTPRAFEPHGRRTARRTHRRSPATSTTTWRSPSSSSPSGSRWRRSGSTTVTWKRSPRTWTTSAPSRSEPPSWCARSCETCIATRSVARVWARPSSPSATKSRRDTPVEVAVDVVEVTLPPPDPAAHLPDRPRGRHERHEVRRAAPRSSSR